jgi:hypothetical protein
MGRKISELFSEDEMKQRKVRGVIVSIRSMKLSRVQSVASIRCFYAPE